MALDYMTFKTLVKSKLQNCSFLWERRDNLEKGMLKRLLRVVLSNQIWLLSTEMCIRRLRN